MSLIEISPRPGTAAMGAADCFRTALKSRAYVLLLQFVFNVLVPDHEPDIFNPPPVASSEPSAADRAVTYMLGGCRRWDALYFLHVAEHGYTYENTLAFFPGFPLAVRLLAAALAGPAAFVALADSSRLLVAAALLNVVCFALAAVALHELTLVATRDPAASRAAVDWFCYNPASVFMTAAYSESLFAALSFGTMYCLETSRYAPATALLAASVVTRSNGILLCGYFAFKALRQFVAALVTATAGRCEEALAATLRHVSSSLTTAACAVLGLLPFVVFQAYAYGLYCEPSAFSLLPAPLVAYGQARNYSMPPGSGGSPAGSASLPPWCDQAVPLSYAYVQRHHWNVGFLRYYELRQLPNFLLAAPGAALSMYCALCTLVATCRAARTAAAVAVAPASAAAAAAASAASRRRGLRDRRDGHDDDGDDPTTTTTRSSSSWYEASLRSTVRAVAAATRELDALPYAVHLATLVAFGWLCVHVQVLTRMLFSSSPLVCQWLGRVQSRGGSESELRIVRVARAYFALYFALGIFAHSNGLPWT